MCDVVENLEAYARANNPLGDALAHQLFMVFLGIKKFSKIHSSAARQRFLEECFLCFKPVLSVWLFVVELHMKNDVSRALRSDAVSDCRLSSKYSAFQKWDRTPWIRGTAWAIR